MAGAAEAGALPAKAIVYDIAYFKEWTSACGARQIQRPYEQLAEDAKAKGRSIQEEMKSRGLDYETFNKSCPQFPVTAWPSAFAELGSGNVLYFHFLTFLAITFVVLYLLQVPNMALYGQEDNLSGWQHNDWQDAYGFSSSQAAVSNGNDTDYRTLSFIWLTPGNFGPNQAETALPPTLFTVSLIVLCAFVFFAYQHQVLTDRQVDAKTTSPNDFAVLVQGLPSTATDETAIKQWFSEHAVRGKSDTDIVKIVIGWDCAEFGMKMKLLKELRKQLAELDPEDPAAKPIKVQIKEIADDIASTAPGTASRLRSSGVVVVVFRYQEDLRACLNKWQSFWARWFYLDVGSVWSLLTSERRPLPLFPIGERNVNKLKVERAANPGDIHWEELGVALEERLKMLAKTNAAMLFVIICSFFICYGFNKLRDKVSDWGESSEGNAGMGIQALAILPALFLGATNMIIVFTARYLGDKEFHATWTSQEFSIALKMTVGMIMNTAGVLYFINTQPRDFYKVGGLVHESFLMLFFNALAPPLVWLADPGYRIRAAGRRKLTQERIDKINEALQATPKVPAEIKSAQQSVNYFKQVHMPSAMDNARRYANVLKTSICCLWYMPVCPNFALVAIAGITLQYWVDKYLLLRWYRRHERPPNCQMSTFSLKFIKYVAPLGLSLAVWLFLTPSWAAKGEVRWNCIVMALISVGFAVVVPLHTVSRILLGLPCLPSVTASSDDDYYQAQYMWAKPMKYHKDQPIYKILPEHLNPEHLSPGDVVVAKVDDFKAKYGGAVLQAAEAAVSAAPAHHLSGGRLVDADAATASAPAIEPTKYGAAAVDVLDASSGGGGTSAYDGTVDPSAGSTEGVALLDDSAGSSKGGGRGHGKYGGGKGSDTGGTKGSGKGAAVARVRWEFQHGSKWSAFNSDCQEYIERMYQGHLSGKVHGLVNVKTNGMMVTVSFEKMTSKRAEAKYTSAIRRCETE
mmetsp:Transcript_40267/g.85888  ORF Transcript_40267/g.85888 Transcript_40267/m.85888 type:complete len:970 (-) Transcript_40267:132-3041(-)|eukprot:CAMPEP_0180569552 /NCGR_PEP_ID=MMETSP1037_2-20121125/7740_1 /TAXON_ID=632150 /ORGANISM="Azadinium spinosum, Strain 3D9" /LENGTH=969 /DNA_ID=CAMNT_0022586797 /DNA_START=11 /DNA_END=2920 /DNA_ORIENTATION=-